MKARIVENDFPGRRLLQRHWESFDECHAAVNGREAIGAFDLAASPRERYGLTGRDAMP